ncbi:hypothetical protein NE237_027499 [Protea cynaroides]|uniref:F-box domain-containing protein n=1 Tax=Protea cynaroides TaxID=273540 RepID=A0A9Q0GRG9_9MAGN|nr:hypothetical protein NE237_027499 [Protea cynaroides]
MEITNTKPRDAAVMNLNQDIIFEIWSRLPIKYVLRCRSVCKLWYNWGYDASFIDLHMSKSIHQPSHLVLAVKSETSNSNKSSLLMINGEGDHCKTRQIPLGFETMENRLFDIVGSCNGFICLSSRPHSGPIYIHNPITEEAILLPRSHLKNSPLTTTSIGFGFDRLSNKYKVVRVHEIPPMFLEDYKNYERFAEVITVGANACWRKLDFPRSFRFYYGVRPVFLDGIIYWLVHEKPSSPCCGNIVAVDIESEKHWTIECPPLRYSSRKRKSLIHMDGSLAIIDYSSKSMDIWLLEGSKTMGFSFNLTTYDMSGLIYPQHIYDLPVLHMIYQQRFEFLVKAKIGHDTFLLELLLGSSKMRNNHLCDFSIVLYSCIKQQCLSVQGTWKNKRLRRHWMVPTLKSLNAEIDSWTDEGDRLLVRLVQQYGVGNWAQIASIYVIRNWAEIANKYVQVVRTGKQCQERWYNHLCMNIKENSQTPLVFS